MIDRITFHSTVGSSQIRISGYLLQIRSCTWKFSETLLAVAGSAGAVWKVMVTGSLWLTE